MECFNILKPKANYNLAPAKHGALELRESLKNCRSIILYENSSISKYNPLSRLLWWLSFSRIAIITNEQLRLIDHNRGVLPDNRGSWFDKSRAQSQGGYQHQISDFGLLFNEINCICTKIIFPNSPYPKTILEKAK